MDTELTEEAVNYLNTLSPAERDAYYRLMQQRKNTPIAESVESLGERLAEMRKQSRGPTPETKDLMAKFDRRLVLGAEHQLRLFINAELERGGALNMSAVKMKAKNLGIQYTDLTQHINIVATLRDRFKDGKEDGGGE